MTLLRTSQVLLVLACVAVGFVCVIGTAAFLTATSSIHNTATVKTVGVECSVQSVDWGFVTPGETAYFTVHVRATGTAPITLALSTSGWNPSIAEQYMQLGWNYAGQEITTAWTPIALQLTVSEGVQDVTTFSFNIVMVGTG